MRIVRPVGAMCPLSSLLRMKGRRPTDDERGVWVLEDPVVFKVDGYVHNIRAGALTDLASAPWFMRWLIEPEDWPWVTPAVIHDHAYAGLAATRAQADRWWRQAVIAVGGVVEVPDEGGVGRDVGVVGHAVGDGAVPERERVVER